MKIYIDGTIYSLQKGGGITRYTNELIEGFIKLGYEVTLIIHPKTFNQAIKNNKLKIIEIDSILNINNKLLRILTYPFHKLKIEQYFKKNNLKEGVFHSTYFTHYKNLKIPQILTIHDLTIEKFPIYFNKINDKIFLQLTKKAIIKSDAIICVSQQTVDELCNYYKVPKLKTNVTHLGVNPAFNTKTENEISAFRKCKSLLKPYILFVGRRSTYKNFENFILAYSMWEQKDKFLLVTIGGGIYTNKEINLIDKLGLSNNIISFDFVTEEELVMFYNCAHVFIFPSLSEGFGLPLLESMACSTIVLASDLPVFREITGDVPYYFNPHYTESIIKALNDSVTKNQTKINDGLELVKKFTWGNTVEKTLRIYQKILDQNSL
jgi:glycosyltransferase involved in cell wall biosynthesis